MDTHHTLQLVVVTDSNPPSADRTCRLVLTGPGKSGLPERFETGVTSEFPETIGKKAAEFFKAIGDVDISK